MIDVVVESAEKLKWKKYHDEDNKELWLGGVDFAPVEYEILKKSSTNYSVKELGNNGSVWSLGWAKTLADAKEIADKAWYKRN